MEIGFSLFSFPSFFYFFPLFFFCKISHFLSFFFFVCSYISLFFRESDFLGEELSPRKLKSLFIHPLSPFFSSLSEFIEKEAIKHSKLSGVRDVEMTEKEKERERGGNTTNQKGERETRLSRNLDVRQTNLKILSLLVKDSFSSLVPQLVGKFVGIANDWFCEFPWGMFFSPCFDGYYCEVLFLFFIFVLSVF